MGRKKKKKHIYDGTYDDECLKEDNCWGRIGRLFGQGNSESISNRRSNCLVDDMELAGYFPHYRSTSVLSDGIDWNNLTTLLYFGATPQEDGSILITNTSHFTSSLIEADNNSTPTTLAVGGYYESEHFSTIAASESLRQAFAISCLTLCQDNNLSGINIDWEFPLVGEEDNVVLLFKELYQTLNPQGYRVSTALNASPFGLPVWKAEAFQYIDLVYAMSYDDDREGVTNHSSVEYLIESLEALVELGVPKNKILGGIPSYTRGDEVLTYKSLLDSAVDKEYVFNNSSFEGKNYNGKDIIAKKGHYVLNNGFKGLFFWEIGQDDYGEYSLLNTAYKTLSKCIKR
jgi:chitinase